MKALVLIFMFSITGGCGISPSTSTVKGETTTEDSFDPDAVQAYRPFSFFSRMFSGYDSDVLFRNHGRIHWLTYTDFSLFGPATISISTTYHDTRIDEWDALNRRIDTVLYLYTKTESGFGELIAIDDDSGEGKFSKLEMDLDEGDYRLLVRRRYEPAPFPRNYAPIVDLSTSCEGSGCTRPPPPPRVCDEGDWDCLIGEAVGWGDVDEVDPRVTRPFDEEAASPAVLESIADASRQIEARHFPGTDYGAAVYTVVEVLRSQDDPTVVGYAVIGFGNGEPDYQDVIIFGFDTSGHQVFYLVEIW